MPQPPPSLSQIRVPNRELYSWAAGGAAEMLLDGGLMALFVPLFTTAFGMDPVVVGLAVSVPLFIDALLDPFIGYTSDNLHTKWGRRRPFMFLGAILTSAIMLAIWWMPLHMSDSIKAVWIVVASSLYRAIFGCYTLPRAALGWELTDDYNERTRVAAVGTWFMTAVGLATAWTYWLVQQPVFGGEIQAVRMLSVAVAVVFLVMALIPVFLVRERYQRANQQHFGMWTSIVQTMGCKPFRHLIYLRVTYTLSAALSGSLMFFVGVYFICGGDKSLSGLIGGYGGWGNTLLALTVIPVMPALGRRFGKRSGLVVGFGAMLAISCVAPLVLGPSFPWMMLILGLFGSLAGCFANLFLGAFMGDICDIDEIESGQRREGLFASVAIFIKKLEFALIGLLSGLLVKLAGFDGTLSVQPDHVLDRLRWFTFAPPIIIGFLNLWLAWRFPINHEMMAKVRAELDARRAVTGLP